jgi:hypothetical protein
VRHIRLSVLYTTPLFQVRPRLVRYTPVGTRVCCYWSSQLSFLYPGTVTAVSSAGEQLVTVRLDDGDERAVHVDSVRLLPADYPLVEAAAGGPDDGTVENSTLSSLTVQVEFFPLYVFDFLILILNI